MTLDDLIDRLETIREDLGGDLEIRGAFQPNYPLVSTVEAITTLEIDDADRRGVYIALGDGTEYGTSVLWADDVLTDDDLDLEEACS